MAFHTTRWSLVARAAGDARRDPEAAKALDELCGIYWPAVYALYRAEGNDPDGARDLTQGLFAGLLERGDLTRVDPARGRFRSWLRTCARNWLNNVRDHDRAEKRGGGRERFSIDIDDEESRRAREPVDQLDADALFERRWAQAVIEQALTELRDEEAANGRGELFATIEPTLSGAPPPRPWAELAEQIGTTDGALRVAAHRLRRRFRDQLTRAVRDTLGPAGGDPGTDDAGDELAELMRALSG